MHIFNKMENLLETGYRASIARLIAREKKDEQT